MKKISEDAMLQLLDNTYNLAVNGVLGEDSAEELANDYLFKSSSDEEAIKKLVNWQIAKCGTSGFLSGLGGIITLPVTIPANIASVIYVQIRMIAAIAHIKGYNIKDDRVRSLVYMCLCGKGATDIAKTAGIKIGNKLTESMIKKIPGTTLTKINQKVGFRLVTRFGSKGAINMGKMIPVAGGVIGAGFDTTSTTIIANVAKKTFG